MNDTLEIREARADEIALVQELVWEMAKYEKRPEDMTGTQETLSYWLFERKIATILLLEYEKKVIGYAIYYTVFGSFFSMVFWVASQLSMTSSLTASATA